MREQFTFYRSYFDAIRRLKKAADRAAIYDAIADYALYGNTPELSDAAGAIFDLIKPTLDAAKRKSDGAKGREKSEDAIKIPSRCAQDTDKMPSRYDEVEIEDMRKEKEKERENEKEKEYEKESYIPSVVSPLTGLASRSQSARASTGSTELSDCGGNSGVRKRTPRFAPPTAEEVAAYCRERGNSVDAERFCDFYASKGWKVGKEPMKDWKAAVRTWEKRDDTYGGKQSGDAFSEALRRELER